MRPILQIPESLQDYIYLFQDIHLVQKKEIPDELKDELEKLRVTRNQLYNYPPHCSLQLMQSSELWIFEEFPVPESLKKYNTCIWQDGVVKLRRFLFVPPWLWGKLRVYNKAELVWNEQREIKNYEQNYKNIMSLEEYKIKRKTEPRHWDRHHIPKCLRDGKLDDNI